MFEELVNAFNKKINDDRIYIYNASNNNEASSYKRICEGVFRTTSSLTTRVKSGPSIVVWNFSLEFAVPVDDKDLRLELENKINAFREGVDNTIIEGYKVKSELASPVGEEYTYKDSNGTIRDYVTYIMIGTIELGHSFISLDTGELRINEIIFNEVLTLNLALTNTLEKTVITRDEMQMDEVNSKYDTYDYGRAWSFTMQMGSGASSNLIYKMVTKPKLMAQGYRFHYIQKDISNQKILFEIDHSVKFNSIDFSMSNGMITGATIKVVETL